MTLKTRMALALAGLCALFLVPFVGASAASAYPVVTCSTLSVSTTNPLPGASITVSGSNFQPGASVRLELHSQTFLLTTAVANSSGGFSVQVTLPAGLTGRHDIVATSGATSAGNCPADPFQLIAIQGQNENNNGGNGGGNGAGNGGGGGLSFTGVDIAGLLALAAALLLVGAGLNRRKHAGSSR